MKTRYLIAAIVLSTGALAHAQKAPKLPAPPTCEALAPTLVGREYGPLLTFEIARAKLLMRIAAENGRVNVGTMDFRPDRISLEIQDGRITRAFCG